LELLDFGRIRLSYAAVTGNSGKTEAVSGISDKRAAVSVISDKKAAVPRLP
jgi:hypothetical protein